jgi:rhamnosyl/mannosyltransferase
VARDGLEALTVAPGDTEQLSRALTRLLDDPAFARKLGTSGAARAFGEFDEKLFGSRMRDIYRQAIDARRILNNPH